MVTIQDVRKASIGLLDFHTHSTFSDGGDTPTELVERAKGEGVSAMALTDHHNHAGLEEFQYACKKFEMFGIPFGAEIAAELPDEAIDPGAMNAPDLVILGKNAKIEPFLEYQNFYRRDLRERHVPKVIAGLESAGFVFPPYDLDEECKTFKVPPEILHSFIRYGKNIDSLVKHILERDPKASEEEIRQKPVRFLNRYFFAVGTPAYTERIKGFNTNDAIRLAMDMNCKLFIAHPGGEYGFLSDKTSNYYIQHGIDGIEVRNYFNTEEQNERFDRLARENNLIRSGGSDCHGNNGPFKIGMYDRPHNQLPKKTLEELWDNLP